MDALLRRALEHTRRTEILGYLMQKKGDGGTEESELADSLGLTMAEVGYHLKVLRDADLTVRVHHAPGADERYIAAASAGL